MFVGNCLSVGCYIDILCCACILVSNVQGIPCSVKRCCAHKRLDIPVLHAIVATLLTCVAAIRRGENSCR